MINLISDNIEYIKKICEANSVSELYLFGSALTNNFNSESDLDFAVIFKEGLSPIEKGDAYFNLLEGLSNLLKRKIDLVSYSVIKNPIFKSALDNSKMTLYAAA